VTHREGRLEHQQRGVMFANGRSVVRRVMLRRTPFVRLSVQFSLRISFAKQRQRSQTDQTNGLQVVTRHFDLGWSCQLLRLAIGDPDISPGHIPPGHFPLPFTGCRTFPFHHQHSPTYNIKQSTVNAYKSDSGRSVRVSKVSATFQKNSPPRRSVRVRVRSCRTPCRGSVTVRNMG